MMAQEVEEQLEQVYEIDYQLQRLDVREDDAMNVLKGIQVPLMHVHFSMCCPAATTANAPACSGTGLVNAPSRTGGLPWEPLRRQTPCSCQRPGRSIGLALLRVLEDLAARHA